MPNCDKIRDPELALAVAPRRLAAAAGLLVPLLSSAAAWAEEAAPVVFDSGDTAWVLTSAALVLMMTLPGLALFYGGLVRAKNVLNVLMQCFISAGIAGVVWVLFGYSLAFGTGNSWVGDFSKVGLGGVTLESFITNGAGRNIPEYIFVMFQGMFAIITPALILGAIAERMKFSAWIAFITIWLVVVYCPLAHMVWGGEGWLFKSGAIDFAGGLVVHMSSGFSALVLAMLLGKRRGFGKEPMAPHNLPFCLIGAGLLWAGWFGFNAGSALAASPLATLAFLNTSTAASAAVLAWAAIEWLHRGKPTALGGATAAVAGLVAITPACGNVAPMGALLIGIGVSAVSYVACTFLKPALGYDDSLDVFGVHALGGAWGALASGIFATTLGSGIESNGQQILVQLEGIAFVAVFAAVATVTIFYGLQLVFGSLRPTEEEEYEGLDLSQHSESAYFGLGGGVSIHESAPPSHGAVPATAPAQRQFA
ncbi:MAG TPA: ammonium transporter [Terriglobales bacterium]|nr:ammonium transporter [Terriglobales bacterium]